MSQAQLEINKPSLTYRIRRWFGNNFLRVYALIAFIYLLLPVAYTFFVLIQRCRSYQLGMAGLHAGQLAQPLWCTTGVFIAG